MHSALSATTFVLGTEDKTFSVDEDYLNIFAMPAVYTTSPIPQTTADINTVTLDNTTGRQVTYYLDDGASRSLASGAQATFVVPNSETVSMNSSG